MKHTKAGVRTQPNITISTFKSYSGLFLCRTHATPYLFVFLRPVITILHFEPAGGLELHKVKSIYCWSTVCLSLSLSSTLFLFKDIPKISCTQNTTTRDLCSKLHAYKTLMPTADCILSFTLWCDKALPLLVVNGTAS
jgi:hypothetical protein